MARERERGEAALREIRHAVAGAEIELQLADLSVLSQVRGLAAEVGSRHRRLDILINNAGVRKAHRELTPNGLEVTFAINHLAPFLLTSLLLPQLEAGRPARVINVSSETHGWIRRIPWEDLQGERRYHSLEQYSLTKLFGILFTTELARRMRGRGVTVNAVGPGFLRSGLHREAKGAFRLFVRLAWPWLRPPEDGAQAVCYLASAPELADISGRYFNRMRAAEPSKLGADAEAAQRLWEISAALAVLADATKGVAEPRE